MGLRFLGCMQIIITNSSMLLDCKIRRYKYTVGLKIELMNLEIMYSNKILVFTYFMEAIDDSLSDRLEILRELHLVN